MISQKRAADPVLSAGLGGKRLCSAGCAAGMALWFLQSTTLVDVWGDAANPGPSPAAAAASPVPAVSPSPETAPGSPAPAASPAPSASPGATPAGQPKKKWNVLILGDSMSLCGFGEALDEKFRADPRVNGTYTYMACGTVPKSWVKEKPFLQAKTYCGYFTIETVPGQKKPKRVEDNYGMSRHHRPSAHLVPKVENLLASDKPDILIMQSGTNLFDLFRDRKTIEPTHEPLVRSQVAPFILDVIQNSSTLRRIYWIGSPISGSVSPEIQTFIIDEVKQITAGAATVIDSRPLIPYPYKMMQPDKEHFIGNQMNEWADKIYDIINDDLAKNPLPAPEVFHQQCGDAVRKNTDLLAKKAEKSVLTVTGVLETKSAPLTLDQLKPYEESLVAYVYKVDKVLKGEYTESEIVVMHPAHIGQKPQNLDKYVVGKSYDMSLRPLEGSPWEMVKTSDESGHPELTPYVLLRDEDRYPSNDK